MMCSYIASGLQRLQRTGSKVKQQTNAIRSMNQKMITFVLSTAEDEMSLLKRDPDPCRQSD